MPKNKVKAFRWILLLICISTCGWVYFVYRLSKLNNDLLIAVITTIAITFLVSGALWANEIKKSESMDKDSK